METSEKEHLKQDSQQDLRERLNKARLPVRILDRNLKTSKLNIFIGSVFANLSIGLLVYGWFSFAEPEFITKIQANSIGAISFFLGGFILIVIVTLITLSMGDKTFEEERDPSTGISFRNSYIKYTSDSSISRLVEKVAKEARETSNKPLDSSEAGLEQEGGENAKTDSRYYGAASDDTHFEKYISEVLRSLSAYAVSSEITAQRLLDTGKTFMARGLFFYCIAIGLWQFFANATKPDSHVMYIGMAACSLTFIVIEFLAAWFFKQYRYYVEVSLSCLRVRSVYDRYLLTYYALKSFKAGDEVEARDKMMEALKEDVKWPTYKGAASNDFNYMMESMGAAHTSLEKIRKIFKDSGKGKAQ
ncbi:hypothetical protein [Pseudomonas sp. PS01301]|uniref:hypothetical protein n=1 Tax=Pseudomonas sp. PS01301 TaxID=2991437 RepID=UPI00249CED2F|nr:hypothetical protein [Pseudomonas sp. PS01301]